MKAKYILIIIVIVITLCCAKKEQPEESDSKLEFNTQLEKKSVPGTKLKNKKLSKQNLETPFISKFEIGNQRLLEYTLHLSYDCNNLIKSRETLLKLIQKYGFIKNSRTNTETKQPTLWAEIHIKQNTIYQAVLDFKLLGKLISEEITVIDHTENYKLYTIKELRNKLRITRRSNATKNTPQISKTWINKEEALERSEEQFDQSKFEKWKINDRINWAKINITLLGPKNADKIIIPNFKNALIAITNAFLWLAYFLTALTPFIIITLLIYFNRTKISKLFSNKKGK